MNLYESILSALSGIAGNKTRSLLTMFGIIVGISSVIMIISVGQGLNAAIVKQFESIGLDSFTIETNGQNETIQEHDRLTYDDVLYLQNYEDIAYASGTRGVYLGGAVELMEQGKQRDIYIQAVDADFFKIQNLDLANGRYIVSQDVKMYSPVVIIDEDFAKQIYGRTDVIGEKFLASSYWSSLTCTVIGLEKSDRSTQSRAISGRLATVYMPLSYINATLWEETSIDSIVIKGTNANDLKRISGNAIRLIELRHNNENTNKYTANIAADMLQEANTIVNVFTLFLGFVAAISLLVGGVGVMNIMLVSVTERTKEIGLRKALGATANNIRLQFLIEATILTAIGGLLGIIMGYGGGLLLGKLATMLIEEIIVPVLTAGSVSFVVSISAAVGIVFGVYPAIRASKLDPIEALRFEG